MSAAATVAPAAAPPERQSRVACLDAFDRGPDRRRGSRGLLLEPWLVGQGLTMVYAARGIGKIFFLCVAYAAATRETSPGRHATRRGRLVYLDGEMPASTMRWRLAAIVEADERSEAEVGDADLRVVSRELQERSMADRASLEEQVLFDRVTADADLIVLDDIPALCQAGTENDADDSNHVSERALGMRREGRTGYRPSTTSASTGSIVAPRSARTSSTW